MWPIGYHISFYTFQLIGTKKNRGEKKKAEGKVRSALSIFHLSLSHIANAEHEGRVVHEKKKEKMKGEHHSPIQHTPFVLGCCCPVKKEEGRRKEGREEGGEQGFLSLTFVFNPHSIFCCANGKGKKREW